MEINIKFIHYMAHLPNPFFIPITGNPNNKYRTDMNNQFETEKWALVDGGGIKDNLCSRPASWLTGRNDSHALDLSDHARIHKKCPLGPWLNSNKMWSELVFRTDEDQRNILIEL